MLADETSLVLAQYSKREEELEKAKEQTITTKAIFTTQWEII